jgi:tRNA(Ile)-lysidine synthase
VPVGTSDSDSDLDARLLNAAASCFSWVQPAPKVIGVMVSGGGDSMALLHLMHRVSGSRGWRIEAITVDHGLRTEAATEAAMVARFCASLNIPHQINLWQHDEIAGNLMDQARHARLRLVADWAKARGIAHVVTGHTADDQAENFLVGLSRQSGLDGLSGMRAAWSEMGVTWARPLLNTPREDLRQYLRAQAVAWVEDPTNDDDSYTRVKARRMLAALRPLGITAAKLAAVTNNLDMARSALTHQLHHVALAVETPAGMVRLNRATLKAQPLEIQRRLLIAALRWIAGGVYPPRETALNGLQLAILKSKGATLAGCRMRCIGESICLFREPRAIVGLDCATSEIWDNRWQITGPHAPDLIIRALGVDGLRAIKDWRLSGISRDALIVSPSIWRNSTLIAAPIAGFSSGWAAKPHVSFASFILSH